MKLTSTPIAATIQLSLLLLLLGGCIWAMFALRSCAREEHLEFWSPENRQRIALLFQRPDTRQVIVDRYGPDWHFPFDGLDPEDPEALARLSADPDLQATSAAIWTAYHKAGHLDEFNYNILVRRARVNVGFAVQEGRVPVFLIDSDSWWHIFWSDGTTSTTRKPTGDE